MKKLSRMTSAGMILLLTITTFCLAQQPPPQPDLTIDATTRNLVIDEALKHLNQAYVFPEAAQRMEKAIRERQQRKEYDKITSARSLAEALTSHLQEVSRDKHLRVGYSHRPIPQNSGRQEPSDEERARFQAQLQTTNFGFERVERLPGNVGYLELRGFVPAELGADTAAAAMNFLANADALIIDLRRNGGGSPSMVAFISSYLFDADPVHLNDLYFRPEDSTRQWWTLPHVPGKRFGSKKDVFILTSKRTFSAAEEFTYNLKSRKRATIVGEVTGGGAHPGGPRRINEHFFVWVPTGRAINPITKTNWEGTGVAPDLEVPADLALKTAHLEALQRVVTKVPDEERRGLINQEIEKIRKELEDSKKKAE